MRGFGFLLKAKVYSLRPLGESDSLDYELRSFVRERELVAMVSLGTATLDNERGPVVLRSLWAVLPPGETPLYIEAQGVVFRVVESRLLRGFGQEHLELRGLEVPGGEVVEG